MTERTFYRWMAGDVAFRTRVIEARGKFDGRQVVVMQERQAEWLRSVGALDKGVRLVDAETGKPIGGPLNELDRSVGEETAA